MVSLVLALSSQFTLAGTVGVDSEIQCSIWSCPFFLAFIYCFPSFFFPSLHLAGHGKQWRAGQSDKKGSSFQINSLYEYTWFLILFY